MRKEVRQLIATLPPKQKKFLFDRETTSPAWQAFLQEDQQACRSALSRLLYQIAQVNRKDKEDE